MGELGTSVATEMCGQVRVLKFEDLLRVLDLYRFDRDRRGVVMGIGGLTRNFRNGWPLRPVSAG